jgi:CheY-like chemotaxis protein
VPDTDLVLIVEDQEDDILLMQRAFQQSSLKNPVQYVRTAEDAMAYLNGEGQFANRTEFPLPVLILLDLKLPGKDGFDFLSWVRQQEGFCDLPIVVLTCSTQRCDVNRAYRLGANSLFVKDLDFRETLILACLLRDYWLKKASRPDTSRPARKPSGN